MINRERERDFESPYPSLSLFPYLPLLSYSPPLLSSFYLLLFLFPYLPASLPSLFLLFWVLHSILFSPTSSFYSFPPSISFSLPPSLILSLPPLFSGCYGIFSPTLPPIHLSPSFFLPLLLSLPSRPYSPGVIYSILLTPTLLLSHHVIQTPF